MTGTTLTQVAWSTTCGTIEGSGSTVTFTAPAESGVCVVNVAVRWIRWHPRRWVSLRPVWRVTAFDDVTDGACTWAHCSLREALTVANATAEPDSVLLSASSPVTIRLAGALPVVTQPLTLSGPGPNLLTVDAAATTSAPRRVLDIVNARTGSVSGLTLRGGLADGGAGLAVRGTTDFAFTDIVVRQNQARSGEGGGVRLSVGLACGSVR